MKKLRVTAPLSVLSYADGFTVWLYRPAVEMTRDDIVAPSHFSLMFIDGVGPIRANDFVYIPYFHLSGFINADGSLIQGDTSQ